MCLHKTSNVSKYALWIYFGLTQIMGIFVIFSHRNLHDCASVIKHDSQPCLWAKFHPLLTERIKNCRTVLSQIVMNRRMSINPAPAPLVLLEINEYGIKMTDKSRKVRLFQGND